MTNELSQRRKDALILARAFGWTAECKNGWAWKFSRPDTGGMWDTFHISHQQLCVPTFMQKLEIFEPELGVAVRKVRTEAYKKYLSAEHPQLDLPSFMPREGATDDRN